MTEELETLVSEALSEGEKFMPEIFFWVEAKTGSRRLLGELVLRGALDRLLAAGIIEVARTACYQAHDRFLLEVYRLTPDGWKELWVRQEARLAAPAGHGTGVRSA